MIFLFTDGVTPPMMEFSVKSAFYVFNLVANWAYSRWDLIFPDVRSEIIAKETQYMNEIKGLDQKLSQMAQLGDSGIKEGIDLATSYCEQTGNQLVSDWFTFFGKLFVKYRDGYVITANSDSKNCGCSPVSASYPQAWFDRIVRDTGSHYYAGNPYELKKEYKAKSKLFETKRKTDLSALK